MSTQPAKQRCVLTALRGAVILCFTLLTTLFAQEYRGTISGTVTDAQGAAIPAANVEIRNVETNFLSSVQTNESGSFTAPFLATGQYQVSAAATGFKKSVREAVQLKVGDKLQLDFRLEVGGMEQSVTVTSEAELLETGTATMGQSIDSNKVRDLPNIGRNVFMLATLATGVDSGMYRSQPSQFGRPFDGAGAQMSMGGIGGRYQILLNGIPNNPPERGSAIYMGFVPSPDSVAEVNIQTNLYDAQYGHTSGGVINSVLKNGTNDFHGSMYEFFRNDKLNANLFQSNWAAKPRAIMRWNQPGFVLDGPVILPKLYNGKNKTFFMVSWEMVRNSNPTPFTGTVPDQYQRAGDFSHLVAKDGKPVIIYDPLTTANSGGKFLRQPFAGNILPSARINAVGAKLVNFYPTATGAGSDASGANNYVNSPNSQTDKYNSVSVRIDQQLGSKHKVTGTYLRNVRNQFFPTAGFPAEGSPGYLHYRNNHGGNLDWTSTLNATTVLNLRYGFLLHPFALARYGDQFNLASLGLPSSLIAQLPRQTFPGVNQSDFSGLQEGSSQYNTTYTHSFNATLVKTVKSHTLKAGSELYAMRSNMMQPVSNFGTFSFTRGFTQQDASSGSTYAGNSFASMLLGYPASGGVNFNIAAAYQQLYYGGFIHDDWRVSRRLTLNLGLRWDYEGPMSERYNQQNAGFDATATSPIQAAGMNLKGGLLFTDQNNRLPFKRDNNNWQPRFGAAYRINDKTVLRGGFGMMFAPTFDTGANNGFSLSTPYVASLDSLTPANTLTNPYPGGILQPPGRTQGLSTLTGFGFSYSNPDREVPKIYQYSLGLQRQLPFQSMIEVSFVGNQSRNMGVSKGINEVPAQYFSMGNAALIATTSNPMKGLFASSSSINGATVQQQQLLRPFAQFTGITENLRSIGKTRYDSMQVSAQKRFGHGASMRASYTWSKIMNQTSYLNNQDSWDSLAKVQGGEPNQILTISGNYEVPFFAKSKGLTRAALGGWQVNAVFRATAGVLVGAPGGAFSSGINPKLDSRTYGQWFNTCTLNTAGVRQNCASADQPVAWIQQPSWTLRTLSTALPGIRTEIPPNLDISAFKDFAIRERMKLQFRAEAFNLANTPQFGGPNTSLGNSQFGIIAPNQVNDARIVELALKLVF